MTLLASAPEAIAPLSPDTEYRTAMALGEQLLLPHLDGVDLAALDAFEDHGATLAAGITSENAATTVDLLERLVRFQQAPTDGVFATSSAAEIVRRAAAGVIVGWAAPELIRQTQADTELTPSVGELLLKAYAIDPTGTSFEAVNFIATNLPAILARLTARGAQRRYQAASHGGNSIEAKLTERDEIAELSTMATGVVGLALEVAPRLHRPVKAAVAALATQAKSEPYQQEMLAFILDEEDVQRAICKIVGLPYKKLSEAWDSGYNYHTRKPNYWSKAEYREACCKRMLCLEDQYPGICRVLYRLPKIRNFGRYPEAMLLGTYRALGKKLGQVVYFLSSGADCDGSATTNSIPIMEQTRQTLEANGIDVIVAEFDSTADLIELEERATQAAMEPASFIGVDVHALDGVILAGEEEITVKDVHTVLGEMAARVTRPDGIIFVGGCRCAEDDQGICAALNAISGREVQGSTGSSFLRGMDVSLDADGRPHTDIDIWYTNVSGQSGSALRTFPARTEAGSS